MRGDRDQAPTSRTTRPPNQQEVKLSKAATGGAKDPTAVESRGENLAAPDLDLARRRGSGKPAAWPRAHAARAAADGATTTSTQGTEAPDATAARWPRSSAPARSAAEGNARAPPPSAGEQASRHLDATLLPTRAPRPTASSTAELATKTTAATRPPGHHASAAGSPRATFGGKGRRHRGKASGSGGGEEA